MNTPADLVVLTSLLKGKTDITCNDYMQIQGRAGRTGFGSKEEAKCVVFCRNKKEYEKLCNLKKTDANLVVSRFGRGTWDRTLLVLDL